MESYGNSPVGVLNEPTKIGASLSTPRHRTLTVVKNDADTDASTMPPIGKVAILTAIQIFSMAADDFNEEQYRAAFTASISRSLEMSAQSKATVTITGTEDIPIGRTAIFPVETMVSVSFKCLVDAEDGMAAAGVLMETDFAKTFITVFINSTETPPSLRAEMHSEKPTIVTPLVPEDNAKEAEAQRAFTAIAVSLAVALGLSLLGTYYYMHHHKVKDDRDRLHLDNYLLAFFNFVLMIIGVMLLSTCVYIMKSDWGELIDRTALVALLVGSILILFVAIVGFLGAITDSNIFLIPYALTLLATLILEGIAAGMVGSIATQAKEAIELKFNANLTSEVIKDMNKAVHTQFTTIYDGKKCATVPDSVPMEISCAGSNTYFLERFINKVCLTPGSSSDTSNGDFLECTYGGSGGSGGAKKAYCQCRTGVTQKLETLAKPAFALAVATAVFQFILLVLALAAIFDDYWTVEKSISGNALKRQNKIKFGAPIALSDISAELSADAQTMAKNPTRALAKAKDELVV